MNDPIEHATGIEKFELMAKAKGNDVRHVLKSLPIEKIYSSTIYSFVLSFWHLTMYGLSPSIVEIRSSEITIWILNFLKNICLMKIARYCVKLCLQVWCTLTQSLCPGEITVYAPKCTNKRDVLKLIQRLLNFGKRKRF